MVNIHMMATEIGPVLFRIFEKKASLVKILQKVCIRQNDLFFQTLQDLLKGICNEIFSKGTPLFNTVLIKH